WCARLGWSRPPGPRPSMSPRGGRFCPWPTVWSRSDATSCRAPPGWCCWKPHARSTPAPGPAGRWPRLLSGRRFCTRNRPRTSRTIWREPPNVRKGRSMQRLILMRHAEAERSAPSGRDRDRALSPVGQSAARRMGEALATRGLSPDLALVSNATRTRQTWELAHEAFGDVELRESDSLYNADADVLRRAI